MHKMIVCNIFVHKRRVIELAQKPYYDSHDNRSSPRTAAREKWEVNFLSLTSYFIIHMREAASTHLWSFSSHSFSSSYFERILSYELNNTKKLSRHLWVLSLLFRRSVKLRQKAVEFPIEHWNRKPTKCMPNLIRANDSN